MRAGIIEETAVHTSKIVLAQVMEFAPRHSFRQLVSMFRGDINVRTFTCLDQFV